MTRARFWGTTEHPFTSYSIGYLHDTYEELFYGKVRVKEDVQYLDIRNRLINKYAGRINI